MTTPVLPDIADITTFGGPFVNLAPVVDPTTDVDANYFNRMLAQLASLSHTAPRAWVKVTIAAGVPTVTDHDAVWGGTVGVIPAVTKTANGTFVVTWASSYNDLQPTPESHGVSFRCANLNAMDNSTAFSVAPTIAGSAVTCKFYNSSSTLTDPPGFYLVMW